MPEVFLKTEELKFIFISITYYNLIIMYLLNFLSNFYFGYLISKIIK